jgi:TolA-binding protein
VNYRKAAQMRSADEDYAHLQAGVVLATMSKYDEAAVELETVIRNFSRSSFLDKAMYERAEIEFEQGNYANAVAGYTSLIQTKPTSQYVPYAYTRRAASNFNLKEYSKTANDYIAVLENFPSHPASKDVLIPLQEALNLSNRPGEFDKYLAGYAKAHPDSKSIEPVQYEAAKNLYFNQNYQQAITSLGNYLTSYPQSANATEARYYQAESYYRLKEWNKALSIYQDVARDKNFLFAGKVVGRLAELEFKQANYAKAVANFQELVKVAAIKKNNMRPGRA